jgi:anaerobic selenocysteine-containing dehydrogenase
MFVEMSESLAQKKGIKNGDKVRVSTERGSISAFVLVTGRLKPFIVQRKSVEQVGMPWHFGYAGMATGDSANVLTPDSMSPSSNIPEYKAFLCNVEKEGNRI